jgi:hypothetical protein
VIQIHIPYLHFWDPDSGFLIYTEPGFDDVEILLVKNLFEIFGQFALFFFVGLHGGFLSSSKSLYLFKENVQLLKP